MKNKRNPLAMLFCLGFVFLLISCPEGMTEEMLLEVHDEVAPVFSNVVPEDGFAYGAYTQIGGTVTDQDNSGDRGFVESLTLEIVDITEPISITVNDDGSFSSEILTTFGSSYSGSITVRLTATDWNGNSTVENLNYSKAEGEITNFTVTRGNKKVSLSWDGLGDGNYIYYVKELFYGLGEITIESDEDTVTVDWPQSDMADLDNGKNYTFYVYTTATDEDETTLTSPMVSTMPLSPLSCTPIVHDHLGSNDLLWPELSDADKYVIQRSDSLDGTWETIGITTKNYLKDSNHLYGANYYRVYPYSTVSPVEDEIIDELATGMVDDIMYSQLGDLPSSPVATYADSGFKSIAIEGNYAYICKDSSITVLDISSQDSTPVPAGTYTAPSGVTIMDLSIKGAYGFLSCRGSTSSDPDLILLDLSDPAAPTATGQLALATSDTTPIEFFAIRSFLYGPYLYILMDKITDTYEGILTDSVGTYAPSWGIVDVSDMSEPVYLGRNTTFSDSADMIFFRHHASNKNIAVLNADNNSTGMTGGYICYFELTDPLLLLSSSFDYAGIMDPMTYKGRIAYGDNMLHNSKLYVETQLGVYDFSLTTPNGSTGYETSDTYLDVFSGEPGNYHNLIALGNYGIYNTRYGIGKYTLTDMENGSAVNDLSCTAYDIEVKGQYAYVVTSTGIKVFKLDWQT